MTFKVIFSVTTPLLHSCNNLAMHFISCCSGSTNRPQTTVCFQAFSKFQLFCWRVSLQGSMVNQGCNYFLLDLWLLIHLSWMSHQFHTHIKPLAAGDNGAHQIRLPLRRYNSGFSVVSCCVPPQIRNHWSTVLTPESLDYCSISPL